MFVWNSLAILKKYYGFVVDEFSKLVHTIKSPGSAYLTAARHGLKETKCLAVTNLFTKFPRKATLRRVAEYLMFVQKSNAILKVILH